MKNIFYFTLILLIGSIITPTLSQAQIDAQIVGNYNILIENSVAPARKIKITKNQVKVTEDGRLVENYFLYKKNGKDNYVLQRVKPGVTSINTKENKDRKLYKVIIMREDESQIKLKIIQPNGKEQLLTLKKEQN